MFNDIYDDVIRSESEGMNRERLEMTVDIYESADCVRDHDLVTETNTHQPPQQTGSDSAKTRSSRAAVVCLVLLCVLLLTAVIVLCVHIHTNNTNYTEETHQLLAKITNLTEKRDQLLTKNTNLTKERDELLTKNTNLTNERDELLTKNDNLTKQSKQFIQERNELVTSLHKIDGWKYYKFSFYLISFEWKSWTESRRYCTEKGADLIIINDKDEQHFVQNSLATGTYVWIGLTDIDVKGEWKWVDNSTLTSGFWASGQPTGGRVDNCALTYSSGWDDYQCSSTYGWICEKSFVKNLIP
ncbi:CD209 antigen-like protein C [Labeo rohita]|uniref:CD209 antigen-like protein C n=1 Tax=Labeo rohita TaxID=84645 RepID=UPI0021E1FA4D|nr:CD209 antigen-like protein C [Labeo rohita]